MKSLKIYILRHLLKKKCPYSIPRSGEGAEEVDCFNVFLFRTDKPYMVLTEVHDNEISGKLWSPGSGYGDVVTINIKDIHEYEIRITHHYGLYDTKYIGLLNYCLTGFTRFDELKCKFYRWRETTKQFFYNRKQLATFDRIEILRALIELKIFGHGDNFMAMDILTHLYSMRWVAHPESDFLETRIQLFVDSFVESGELSKIDGCHYSVTGKAINTLSQYEEQERRHNENKKLQKRMLCLTIAIVGVGILQAAITLYKN